MKVNINKQSAEKKAVPEFKAGDIVIIETSTATYPHLASKCLKGSNEWILVDLGGYKKWTEPNTKANLISNLEMHVRNQNVKITVIPSEEVSIDLNI